MRKKALQAFTGMLRELKSGGSVIVTADVPKVSRVAGLGIVTLAKYSQCPILPVAMATSRLHPPVELGPHLLQPAVRPHGRWRAAPRSASRATPTMRRSKRRAVQVENALNAVTERAYVLARTGGMDASIGALNRPLRRPCGALRICCTNIEFDQPARRARRQRNSRHEEQPMAEKPAKQLLHLVLGGELSNIEDVEFKDLDQVDIVGLYPNYAIGLYGLEEQGAEDGRQCPHALLHRPSASPA